MEHTHIERIERQLLRERAKILRSLDRFREQSQLSREATDADLSSYRIHMADQGTDAMEREKAFLLASKEGRYLYRIEEALRRLYDNPDTFGVCQQCGQTIPIERLDALPHARYCLDCKLREEKSAD